ncbi:MAG: ATP-dependent zinc metalloprotease FtsH, partial [Sphingobacteriia bacterium]|nr:ATP-dependent zinc metalloprotease FtsH [Sphingobacteriia bacterium]
KKKRVMFKDVAGAKEAKEELMEVVEFLKHPKKFIDMGAKIPKGVLLLGPPGTGKTLVAKAVAGEAGVPFFNISGSEFVEMFVGVGASRVRDLFKQAKKKAPAIVFIDEIDAVGRHRGAGLGGGHDEREQTLNQILVEMDGFETDANIIVLAATNRPDVLDPALLRPGRFDRRVTLDLPDINERKAILGIHCKNKKLEKDVNIENIAQRTPGFSGADLANLVNEAAILSARKNKTKIGMEELRESIEKVMMGPERKSRVIRKDEQKIVAYHEAGHALVAAFSKNADPVQKISIISRGNAGGYTMAVPTEDKMLHSRGYFLDEIAVLLSGFVTEQAIFGDVTTGASNDLERATNMARNMVTRYGMSSLGPRTFGKKEELIFLGKEMNEEKNYSEKTAQDIDHEVSTL